MAMFPKYKNWLNENLGTGKPSPIVNDDLEDIRLFNGSVAQLNDWLNKKLEDQNKTHNPYAEMHYKYPRERFEKDNSIGYQDYKHGKDTHPENALATRRRGSKVDPAKFPSSLNESTTKVKLKMDSYIGVPVTIKTKPGKPLEDVTISWSKTKFGWPAGKYKVTFEKDEDGYEDRYEHNFIAEFFAESDDGKWQFILDVTLPSNYADSGNIDDYDWKELIIQRHPDFEEEYDEDGNIVKEQDESIDEEEKGSEEKANREKLKKYAEKISKAAESADKARDAAKKAEEKKDPEAEAVAKINLQKANAQAVIAKADTRLFKHKLSKEKAKKKNESYVHESFTDFKKANKDN